MGARPKLANATVRYQQFIDDLRIVIGHYYHVAVRMQNYSSAPRAGAWLVPARQAFLSPLSSE